MFEWGKINKYVKIYLYTLFWFVIILAIQTSINYPVSDSIYYIKLILIPYAHGQLPLSNFFILRVPHDHTDRLYELFLILDYKLFHLNFRVILIIGLLGLLAYSFLVAKSYESSFKSNFKLNIKNIYNLLVYIAAYILILTKLISFNETYQYQWPILVFEDWTLVLSIFTFYIFNKIYISHISNNLTYNMIFFGWLIIIIDFFIGSAPGLISIFISLIILFFITIVDKDKKFVKFVFSFLIVFIICYFIFSKIQIIINNNIHYKYSLLSLDSVKFIIYSFSQAIISIKHIHNSITFSNKNVSLIIGSIWIFINIITLFFFIKNRYYKQSIFPLFLLFLSYAFIFGVLLIRFRKYGINYVFEPRYVRLFEFNVLAVTWMLSINIINTKKRLKIIKKLTILLLMLFSTINLTFVYPAIKEIPWVIHYTKQEEHDIRLIAKGSMMKSNMPRINVCCAKEVFHFLKREHLALFEGEFK